MELGRVVVMLVDASNMVDDVRLHGRLMDDRLDDLPDMMMDMLAAVDRDMLLGLGGLGLDGLVFVLGFLLAKSRSNLRVFAMLEPLGLDRKQVMVMLLWENLPMVDWLDAGMMVGLMNLPIHSCIVTMMLMGRHGLMDDSRRNLLVDGSVMLALLGEVLIHICLGLIHGGGEMDDGVKN